MFKVPQDIERCACRRSKGVWLVARDLRHASIRDGFHSNGLAVVPATPAGSNGIKRETLLAIRRFNMKAPAMHNSPSSTSLTSPAQQIHLSKPEVCDQLQISARCLEGLISRREFPPGVRIGKHVRFSKSVVDEWLRRQFAVQEQFFARQRR